MAIRAADLRSSSNRCAGPAGHAGLREAVVTHGKRRTPQLPSPVRAIRRFCLECQGSLFEPDEDVWGNTLAPTFEYRAVRECVSVRTCPLWPCRLGKDVRLLGRNAGRRPPTRGSQSPVTHDENDARTPVETAREQEVQ